MDRKVVKVGAIVQARISSERLPGKIMMPLPIGTKVPLLGRLLGTLKECKLFDSIVLATSTRPENNILQDVASEYGAIFHAGSEENVLDRFVEAATVNDLDVVFRITGDNPLFDCHSAEILLDVHLKTAPSYTYSVGLPTGLNLEVISTEALRKVAGRSDLITEDLEHVTWFFRRTNFFSVKEQVFDSALTSRWRVTVDYPADYALLNLVFLVAESQGLSGLPLLRYIELHYPWLREVNSFHVQKVPQQAVTSELPHAIELMKANGLSSVLAFLSQFQDR